MKILIIGSSGLLGTALTMKCAERGIPFVGTTHEDLEITHREELESWVSTSGCDTVINTAAMVGINQCEHYPVTAFKVNTVAPANLAHICRRQGITLVQISTHTVFDGRSSDPYTEFSVPNPLNIYGASKYAAECLVRNICPRHYIVRLPTLFGPRRNSRPGFSDKVLQWIAEGKALRIADDKIDSPSYTLDVADALLLALRTGGRGNYHIANAGAVSFYDFVLEIVRILGARVEVQRAKDWEFQPLAQNPLKTAMASVYLPPLRGWTEALEEYLRSAR
ncbi:MAG: NAD(P)-dependent oxidoreductase [Patescibacteria group bacterium]